MTLGVDLVVDDDLDASTEPRPGGLGDDPAEGAPAGKPTASTEPRPGGLGDDLPFDAGGVSAGASTEPRPGGLGDTYHRHVQSVVCEPQRSRGPEASVTSHRGAGRARQPASTEPRPGGLGDPARACRPAIAIRASTEPRPGGLGDRRPAAPVVVLLLASTEPRPGGLGDHSGTTQRKSYREPQRSRGPEASVTRSHCSTICEISRLNGAEARRPR